MSLLTWILLFCLLGGALSVAAAGVFLLLPEAVRNRLLPHGVSFAIGALLGAAGGFWHGKSAVIGMCRNKLLAM